MAYPSLIKIITNPLHKLNFYYKCMNPVQINLYVSKNFCCQQIIDDGFKLVFLSLNQSKDS